MDTNPYKSPSATIPQSSDTLPDFAVRKATNIIRDAKLAIVVALIPLLGLVYILRLVQWYQLRAQFPILGQRDTGEHSDLSRQFRSALSSIWFAVLLWPLGLLIVFACLALG